MSGPGSQVRVVCSRTGILVSNVGAPPMRHRCTIEALPFLLLAYVMIGAAVSSADDRGPVPYPEGFRSWVVVRSLVIGPDHATFANRGGMHHYYANEKAVVGYRTGSFPDGSIVVD